MSQRIAVRASMLAALALLLWLLAGATPISQASAPPLQPPDPVGRAMAYARANAARFGVQPNDLAELAVSDSYLSDQSGLSLVYLQQQLDGINVHNAIVNIAMQGNGSLFYSASSAVAGLAAGANRGAPTLSPEQAVTAAAAAVGLPAPTGLKRTQVGSGPMRPVTFNEAGISLVPITARLVWQPTAAGVRLTWEIAIETLDQQHAWMIRVDAATGEALDRNDLVAHDNWGTAPSGRRHVAERAAPVGGEAVAVAPAAPGRVGDSYRVYPVPVESPNHTSPAPPADGRTLVTDPDDALASPFGWHDTNGAAGPEFTTTQGNNVHAYTDTDANNTPDPGSSPSGGAGPLLTFDFPLDLTQPPSAYRPAAVTNLFYWNNVSHDLNYLYGFDEASGNFQVNNYGRGGLGSDDVRAEAQDGSGTDNANFYTPADGLRPRMQMYIWTDPTPDKDGDLDSGIILHEYGHGISNRLTGGPSNVSCLSNNEQGGEGWSDWQSLVFTALASHTGPMPRGVGTYALDQPVNGPGIRAYPYSTDMSVDPRTYQDTRTAAVPHGVGSIWTAILWESYWQFVGAYGFEPNFYNASSTAGNIRMIRLVNEAMKLQPCSPGFVDARNAILAANQALYNGEGQCLLWAGFAKRGLGENAVQGSSSSNADNTNGFNLPTVCGGPTATPTPTPLPGQYCNTLPITIPSSGPGSVYPSNIPVTGEGSALSALTVTFNGVSHTFPDDIDIMLVAPNGSNATIWSDAGGSTDIVNATITLDDGAAAPLPDNSAITAGSYRPANYGATDAFPAPAPAQQANVALSTFVGSDPNGTWSLYVVDDAAGDSGAIAGGWCLQMASSGQVTPTATNTPTPTATNTSTPTPTVATSTPTWTSTATPTVATSTATSTSTATPTVATSTATTTSTATPTVATSTPTWTSTATPTVATSTATATVATSTATPTVATSTATTTSTATATVATSTATTTSTATVVTSTATATVATSTATMVASGTPTMPPTSIELGELSTTARAPLGGWLISLAGLTLVAVGIIIRRRR